MPQMRKLGHSMATCLAQGITEGQGKTQDLNSDLEFNPVILEARVTQRVPYLGLGKGTLHHPPAGFRHQGLMDKAWLLQG